MTERRLRLLKDISKQSICGGASKKLKLSTSKNTSDELINSDCNLNHSMTRSSSRRLHKLFDTTPPIIEIGDSGDSFNTTLESLNISQKPVIKKRTVTKKLSKKPTVSHTKKTRTAEHTDKSSLTRAKGKELNLVCSPNHIEEVIESVIKKSAIYGHKQAEKINRNLVETIKSVANGVYLKETEPTTLHQANSGFNGIPEDLLINSKTLSLLQPYIRLELLSNEVICNNTPKIYRKQVVPRKRDGPRNKNTTLKRKILQKSKCLRLGMNQNRKIRKKVLRDGNKNSIPVLETSTDNEFINSSSDTFPEKMLSSPEQSSKPYLIQLSFDTTMREKSGDLADLSVSSIENSYVNSSVLDGPHDQAHSSCETPPKNSYAKQLFPFNIKIVKNVGSGESRSIQFMPSSTNYIEPHVKTKTNYKKVEKSFEQSMNRTSVPPVSATLEYVDTNWNANYYNFWDQPLKTLSTDLMFREANLSNDGISESSDTFHTKDILETNIAANPIADFKEPLLPPAKRPPTRKKTSNSSLTSEKSYSSSNSSVSTPSNQNLNEHNRDDDAISVYSHCSLGILENNGANSPYQEASLIDSKSKSFEQLKEKYSTEELQNHRNFEATQQINCSSMRTDTKHNSIVQNNYQRNSSTIFNWIESNNDLTKRSCHRFPYPLENMCYFFYYEGNCTRGNRCNKKHYIPSYIKQDIKLVDYRSFVELYKIIKINEKFFVNLIHAFIEAFQQFHDQSLLSMIVKDILRLENYDKTPYIENLVKVLQNNGCSFVNAVDKIILSQEHIGRCLLDILLYIVCIKYKTTILENWEALKRICGCRKEFFLDPGVIEDVVIYSYMTANTVLAKNIIEDIVIPNHVVITKLNSNIIMEFYHFLESRQLQKEADTWKYVTSLNIKPDQQRNTRNEFEENAHCQNNNDQCKTTCHLAIPNNLLNGNLINESNIQYLPNQTENTLNNMNGNVEYEPSTKLQDQSIYNFFSSPSKIISNLNPASEGNRDDNSMISSITSSDSSILKNGTDNEDTDEPFSETGLKELSNIIEVENIDEFIQTFIKLCNTSLAKNFIMHCIGIFKRKSLNKLHDMIIKFVESIEKENIYKTNISMKDEYYMLIINTVALFVNSKSYTHAAHILSYFFQYLENLVATTWIKRLFAYIYSDIGKYIYFCKIFSKGGYLQQAVSLLMSPRLKLLKPYTFWTLSHHNRFDTDFRNDVVERLISITLRSDIGRAKFIILSLLTDIDQLTEIKIWKYFNVLLVKMLDGENNFAEDIKGFLPNIIQGWYKHLTSSVLRGLLIQLVSSKVPINDLIGYYRKCFKQQVYHRIKGSENFFVIRTYMMHEEIYMILLYYFFKLAKYNMPIQNIALHLKMTNTAEKCPKIILNSDHSLSALKNRILKVLATCFPFAINIDINAQEKQITIPANQMKPVVTYYKKKELVKYWN